MTTNQTYLIHHGIIGQRWGVRRFQNPDGSLTEAGRKRLANYNPNKTKIDKNVEKIVNSDYTKNLIKSSVDKVDKAARKVEEEYKKALETKEFKDIERQLSDWTWDATVDDWTLKHLIEDYGVHNKEEYYNKLTSNPKDPIYIWNESEPSYYLNQNPSKFKAFNKAEKQHREAYNQYLQDCKKVAKELIGNYEKQIGTYYSGKPRYNSDAIGILIYRYQDDKNKRLWPEIL